MKKGISVLLVMIMAVSSLMLVACGGGKDNGKAPSADSAYVGTWEAVRAEFKGEAAPIEEILEEGEVFIIELHEDGTAKVTTEKDKVDEGSWTENSKGVHVKAGETDLDFEAEGETLFVSILGAKLVFEKQ